jgi:hypothetical protein
VQPNVLKKSDLEGTFYYLQTVVDAPPTNGAMFKGLSSDLLKIKFDVQENFIYAVRAFEHIENSEDEAEANRLGYKGQPLAAWRISHFDIIRDYNSTTGEQTNRVIESMERPWYQREFIRVDWSMNLVTDFNGLGLSMFFDNLRAQGVSYWESDPSKPDGIHIEHVKAEDKANKEGLKTGELAYLDVTNQMIVDPSMNEIPGYGTFPQCFFYYDQEDCASQLVKVRHAFVKVAPEHKYEPLKWDGKKMKLFGQWDVGLRRLSYNREYGVTNSGFIRHAARFNIWTQDSYENGNLKGPDEVTPNTIPYYASGSRAIKYQNHDRFPDGFDYVYPEELYEDFKRIVGEWNDGMKTAAALYKKIDLNDEEAMKKLPNVFVPCHNPVDYDADDEACWKDLPEDLNADGTVAKDKQGRAIRHARQGDPRRSNIYWVNEQQNAGPLGYGPGKYDPQTGETISGQAYIYGAAIETYATRSRDMVMLLNGDITTDDFVAGQNVKDWVAANKFGKGPGESKVGLISTQMDKRAATSHGRSLSDGDGRRHELQVGARHGREQHEARRHLPAGTEGVAPDARRRHVQELLGPPRGRSRCPHVEAHEHRVRADDDHAGASLRRRHLPRPLGRIAHRGRDAHGLPAAREGARRSHRQVPHEGGDARRRLRHVRRQRHEPDAAPLPPEVRRRLLPRGRRHHRRPRGAAASRPAPRDLHRCDPPRDGPQRRLPPQLPRVVRLDELLRGLLGGPRRRPHPPGPGHARR